MQDAQLTRPLSGGQKLMWYELMYIANVAGWPEWFEVWTSDLERRTELSAAGVKKARKALADKGYIEYEARGNKAARYRILSQIVNYCEEDDDTADTAKGTVHEGGCEPSSERGCELSSEPSSELGSVPSSERGCELGSDIHRLDKTREEETRGNTPPKSPQGEPPEPPPKKRTAQKAERDVFAEFAGEDLRLLQTLRDFEEMRNAIKEPLTQRARQGICNRLKKLSPNSAVWVEILEQSIMSNWKGVYELHEDKPRGKARQEKGEGNIFLEMLKEREAAREEAELIEL